MKTTDLALLGSLRSVRDTKYVPDSVLDEMAANGWIAWSRPTPRSSIRTCELTMDGRATLDALERTLAAFNASPGG